MNALCNTQVKKFNSFLFQVLLLMIKEAKNFLLMLQSVQRSYQRARLERKDPLSKTLLLYLSSQVQASSTFFFLCLVQNFCNHDFYCLCTGAGPDKEKPPCKKAKLLRLERRNQKLACKGISSDLSSSVPKQDNSAKKLEDFLYPEMTQNPAHRLQVNIVFLSEIPVILIHHTSSFVSSAANGFCAKNFLIF